MLTPPADLDVALVRSTLLEHWPLGVSDLNLTYLPVGFGSHHWSATAPRGERWFVTVDDHRAPGSGTHQATTPADLDAALRAVATLRDRHGLAFVHGPLLSWDGAAARPVGTTGWTASVFTYLDAEAIGSWDHLPGADRADVLGLLARLHTVPVPADHRLRRVDLVIGRRGDLDAALGELGRRWGTGPYAERARDLLAEHAGGIRLALAAHDARAAVALACPADWVVTHGEPHGGNILRDRSGVLHVVDWDTVAVGPRERDLWMLAGHDDPDWTDYRDLIGWAEIDRNTIRTYRLWWDLNDLAEYIAWFRVAHTGTAEAQVAWDAISGMLPLSPDFF